ncbi:MAG: DUF4293 domain-containing protein [Chitinophagaceae bacterium]|nr:DUF4293 domain-containing protein [Chitinophagaceae bacterium]MCW5905141.1 DUF4293 domain-containing protein [Chitinophagaceae bacterium]
MIQRIQSLWLLIASLLSFSTLKFDLFYGSKLINGVAENIAFTAKENLFVLILTIAVSVALLVSIFLYKDRKMQLKITTVSLIVSIMTLLLAYYQTKKYIDGKFTVSSIIYFAIPIFIFLAIRAIYKDEQLVKSTDRLR